MPALNDEDRRNKDIYEYVMSMLSKKVGDVQLYRYEAILEKANEKFYLAPDTIGKIVRNYVPEVPDPDQLDLFKVNDAKLASDSGASTPPTA